MTHHPVLFAGEPVDYSLYLVTDRPLAGGRSLVDVVRRAVMGGVRAVQVREKDASVREYLAFLQDVKAVLEPLKVPLFVNDRVDVALASDAAGVHVGQQDMPCADVRRLVGPSHIIGVSISTPEEAAQAEAEGADYLAVSPVFVTPTKTDTPQATGLEGLGAIREATRLPLVAIGGIHVGNAASVVAAGADGVAVVSAIMAAEDPEAASRELLAEVARGRGGKQ
ncbi:MAG: thiamine phosphate synthase [Polyangiaceae bacterium]|nr:thiamine phosphate synthase [Polyangiaceae bacterium]